MRNPISDTEQFYAKQFPDVPQLTAGRLQWRINFLREELREFEEAFNTRGAEDMVDGLIDLMVVTLGTLYEAGVDIDLAWTVVHEANMQKVRGDNPTRPSRFGGPMTYDLVKPPGWTRPDHSNNTGTFKDL